MRNAALITAVIALTAHLVQVVIAVVVAAANSMKKGNNADALKAQRVLS